MKAPSPIPLTEAHRALYAALDELRGPTPCTGPDARLWISEEPADKQHAAQECAPCAVLELCHRAGLEGHEIGVWGGQLLTGKTPKTTRRTA